MMTFTCLHVRSIHLYIVDLDIEIDVNVQGMQLRSNSTRASSITTKEENAFPITRECVV